MRAPRPCLYHYARRGGPGNPGSGQVPNLSRKPLSGQPLKADGGRISVFGSDAVERIPGPHHVEALPGEHLERLIVLIDLANLFPGLVDFLHQKKARLVDFGQLVLKREPLGDAPISGGRRYEQNPGDHQHADCQPRGPKLFQEAAHALFLAKSWGAAKHSADCKTEFFQFRRRRQENLLNSPCGIHF